MEFSIPHTPGAAPNTPNDALGKNALAVVLVDPASGQPVTPAGAVQGVGAGAGVSLSGSAGVASAVLIPTGTFKQFCIIQNTSANVLHLSFNTPAVLTDFQVAAGASVTLPAAFANALNGIGSAAATTWTAIGV